MANLSSYISTNTPASLNDLSDLSTSGASTGEVLSVNSDGTFSFIAIGGGTTSYNTIGDLPLVDNDTGDTAFVTANNKLYVWNGSGWYTIATVNETPTWDSGSAPESTYTVPNDGSSLTITLAASDPDGFPITYTAVTDSEFDAFAEITQNSDESFTVTMLSSASVAATGTVTFRASDGVNILSNVSTFSITFITVVENSKYTSALVTSVGSNGGTNSTVTDSSTNNHTITVNGNASSQTFSPYRAGGYSYNFDGSGDYLSIPDGDWKTFGANDFTIEMWFNSTSTTKRQYLFSDIASSGQNDTSSVLLYLDAGALKVYIQDTTYHLIQGSTSYSANVWHHVAVVRNGSTVTLYLDGQSEGTYSIGTASVNDSSNTLKIGSTDFSTAYDFTGYISDVRVVKGSAVYTSAFTPPTERLEAITNTALLTCHLPYIVDGSSNDHSITVAGNVSAKPFGPYDYSEYDAATHGGSVYFDGSGDYLSIPDDSSLELSSSDFTLEAWIHINSATSGTILAKRASASVYGGYSLFVTSGRGLQFIADNDTSAAWAVNFASSDGIITQNQWHHVAATRSGSSWNVWLNGQSVASTTSSITINDAATNTGIGAIANGEQALNGFISDVRIVKGTALYTSTFTPPTEPLTAITNTSLLISGTDASIIDKSQSTELTLVGDTQSSTSQTKYASSSIYFDGSDRIDIPNPGIPALSGDFTLETWIYPTAVNYGAIFARGFGNNGGLLVWVQTTFSARFYRDDGVQLNIQNGSSIPANQWTHIAITREGSNLKTFVNGTVDQTATMDPANYGLGNTSKFEIGAFNDNQQYFNGYMEDWRITNGLARYTANFTPPTASLEA